MPIVKVPRPKYLLFDVSGTVIKTGFIEQILLPYIRENVDEYVQRGLNEKDSKFLRDVERLRKQAMNDLKSNPCVPQIANANADPTSIEQTVVANIRWHFDTKHDDCAQQLFRYAMWIDGYNQHKIVTP